VSIITADIQYETELKIYGTIKPVDVRVYFEDGIPYMEYVGVAESNFGTVRIIIPKLSLVIESIDSESSWEYDYIPKTGLLLKRCGLNRVTVTMPSQKVFIKIAQSNKIPIEEVKKMFNKVSGKEVD